MPVLFRPRLRRLRRTLGSWWELLEWLRACPAFGQSAQAAGDQAEEGVGGEGFEIWPEPDEWDDEDWDPIDTDEGGYAEDVFLKGRHEN